MHLTSCFLRSKKRTKLNDDADLKKPYATTSTAASAFLNIQIPKMPRAKTKSSLGPQSKLELNTSDSWRNFVPNEEDVVSACLGARESKFSKFSLESRRTECSHELIATIKNEAGQLDWKCGI